jgi:hypothetical protein
MHENQSLVVGIAADYHHERQHISRTNRFASGATSRGELDFLAQSFDT